MRSNRLAGHTLPNEGKLRDASGWLAPYVEGPARCSCGDWSPRLPSAYARKKWHREHKDKIRSHREVPDVHP
jgi:hypothetical protein